MSYNKPVQIWLVNKYIYYVDGFWPPNFVGPTLMVANANGMVQAIALNMYW